MKRRGVTLLEVLVAGVVLSIGLLGVLELIARTSTTTAAVKEHSRALMFTRSKLEEILKEPTLQVGTDRGEGVDETADYDWEAGIDQTDNQSLVLVTVIARERGSGRELCRLGCLRRLDTSPPDTSGTGAAGTGTQTAPPAGGGA